jgi:hypothetical protein
MPTDVRQEGTRYADSSQYVKGFLDRCHFVASCALRSVVPSNARAGRSRRFVVRRVAVGLDAPAATIVDRERTSRGLHSDSDTIRVLLLEYQRVRQELARLQRQRTQR